MALRDASELITPAVAATLRALELRPEHTAAAKLAERYAAAIDAAETAREQAWAARWIGPLLLDCLESLGATPVSHAKVKEIPAPAAAGGLAALRAARRA